MIPYPKHRKQCVANMSEHPTVEEITEAVPEGSILGPNLFNIQVNDKSNI